MHELVETVVAFQYFPAVLGFPKRGRSATVSPREIDRRAPRLLYRSGPLLGALQ
jgi:hypothetical protein